MALTQQQVANAQKYTQAGIQGASAGMAILDDVKSLGNQYKDVNTNSPDQQVDAYGRPIYNAGDLLTTVNSLGQAQQKDTLKNRAKEIFKANNKGSLEGAKAGSVAGPWGALVGGIIGGSIGTFGTFFGQRKRRRTIDKKYRIAADNLFAAQQLYNNSMNSYNNQQFANQEYADQMNTDNRVNNLYSYNQG